MVRRTVAMLALLPMAGRLPLLVRILAALVRDPRVPASRKALLAGALGYVVSPLDLVPERIPIVGMLDDLVIAALALDAFFAGVPDEVLEEKLAEAGLPRAAFDEDVSRVRRTIPRPVRRVVHRLPAALDVGARAARRAGIAPRVRGLFVKEGSPA